MVDRKCQLHRMMLTALAICGAAAESSAEMRISFDERNVPENGALPAFSRYALLVVR